MKILFLTRYNDSGASSRYRVYQYLPLFNAQGIECIVVPLLDSLYIKNIYNGNGNGNGNGNLLKAYLKRLFSVLEKEKYDFVYLEKEFFPFMPDLLFFFKSIGIKYIVDFDDAIFHNYDKTIRQNKFIPFLFKNKIAGVIRNAEYVVCGSPYLTEYALKYNPRVIEIPTSINFSKYESRRINKESDLFTIGWIGSKTTSKHLLVIHDALLKFALNFKCQINLIGFDKELRSKFDKRIPVNFIEWTSEKEIEDICQFTVGIMPLPDEPFERGKCGFKLIQYMASGIPTVATPLDANVKIDRANGNLFAKNNDDWYNNFVEIYHEQEKYQLIGSKNIETVKEHYSIQANLPKYLELFNKIVKKN